MRKRFLAVGLALAVVATGVLAITQHVRTARANSTFYTVCLTGALTSCLATDTSATSPDNSVIRIGAFQLPVPANEQWFMQSLGTVSQQATRPFTDEALDDYYANDYMYYIEKKDSSGGHSGCAGTDASNFTDYPLRWVDCTSASAVWVYSNGGGFNGNGGYFVNVAKTNNSTNGATKWLMSEQIDSGDVCTSGVNTTVQVRSQNSGNCNAQWSFATGY